ncbi:MAG TPA: 50S ribosomal protein L32 [Deltaproteobacteria bacterium]|nr:50S ribosomal protein L32 [Deltaproteobacteria bacterium]
MPLPKRRHSSARRDKRRANDFAPTPAVSFCPNCNEPKAPHRVCPSCGYYKGREVVKTEATE